MIPEISRLLSLSQPNILQFLCGFMDDERRECFLVTETMNILSKARNNSSSENFVHVKITRFGLPLVVCPPQKNSNHGEEQSYIWHAPEVLMEQEESKGEATDVKYRDKSDVYGFRMICFELLT